MNPTSEHIVVSGGRRSLAWLLMLFFTACSLGAFILAGLPLAVVFVPGIVLCALPFFTYLEARIGDEEISVLGLLQKSTIRWRDLVSVKKGPNNITFCGATSQLVLPHPSTWNTAHKDELAGLIENKINTLNIPCTQFTHEEPLWPWR